METGVGTRDVSQSCGCGVGLDNAKKYLGASNELNVIKSFNYRL